MTRSAQAALWCCLGAGFATLLATGGAATAGSLGRAVLLCALASLVATAASRVPALRGDQRSREESAAATSATAASR